MRRIEVFTGEGRRREWSAGDKARIVAESNSGDESVSAVARRHGLTASQLFAWRRAAEKAKSGKAGRKAASFATVVLDDEPPSRERRQQERFDGDGIEIVVGATRIRVGHNVDTARLAAVLRVVRHVGL